jgi:hypothetical protein
MGKAQFRRGASSVTGPYVAVGQRRGDEAEAGGLARRGACTVAVGSGVVQSSGSAAIGACQHGRATCTGVSRSSTS